MKSIESIERVIEPDEDPDTSYLDQEGYEDRRDEYREQRFHFIGIRAVAQVTVNGTSMTISSPGLWGIEDDTVPGYFDDVYRDELGTLGDLLTELGFGASDILEHAPELVTERPLDV